MKLALLFISFLGLLSLSSGLICQRCDNGGICTGPEDNGVPVECQGDEDTCFFQQNIDIYDGGFVVRDCIPVGLTNECYHEIADGFDSIQCFCTTDNCNKDNQCYCDPQ